MLEVVVIVVVYSSLNLSTSTFIMNYESMVNMNGVMTINKSIPPCLSSENIVRKYN